MRWTVHPVCQEELYNPGRDVSINPNENSISDASALGVWKIWRSRRMVL